MRVMVGLKFSCAQASACGGCKKETRARECVRTLDAGELLTERRFEFALRGAICM
jgi:hypothetical protein